MESQIFDFELKLDFDELKTRGGAEAVIDEKIKVIGDVNQIGISLMEMQKTNFEGRSTIGLLMRCIATPHPDCRFRWLQLEINFPNVQGVRVEDIVPEEVQGKHPVKISTTYSGGISLEVTKIKLGPKAELKRTVETQVFVSEVLGFGKGFDYAKWIFSTPSGQNLHVNRDLNLLISFLPTSGDVIANFTLKTKIAQKGFSRLIPFIGKKSVNISQLVTLQ